MMKIPYSLILITGLSYGLFTPVGSALAAEQSVSLEQRLERLERILRNQSLSDIILRLQQLQQEVRQLRGDLELQAHTLDTLGKRQRDLYIDLDQRLSNLQASPPTQGGVEPAAVPVSPEIAPTSEPVSPELAPTLETLSPEAAATTESVGTESAPSVEPVSSQAEVMETTVEPEPPVVSSQVSAEPVVVTPPDPKKESEAYQAAFNLLQQGRYQDSTRAFQDFLNNYPGGTYEDNAQYWLGEASYVSRNYDTALTEFTKVVENYPSSPKVAGALLKSGYIHYEKQDWQKARELFDKVKTNYPGTTEARLADKRLERMDKEGH